MRTITHAIDTRPFFLPSVFLEKKRPGNEASQLPTSEKKLSGHIEDVKSVVQNFCDHVLLKNYTPLIEGTSVSNLINCTLPI